MEISKAKNIHFIGIGGAGMSQLAFYFLRLKKSISGSDLTPSLVLEKLKKQGAEIFIGHKKGNLPKKSEVVVFSPAILKDNPELKEAKKRGLLALSYPEALGKITENKFTVAVCGTHGKTTTTAMTGFALEKAGFNPTVIVGGEVKKWKGGLRMGGSDFFVVEACEYKRSFLNIYPEAVIITNIEKEHTDYYKNISDIISSFCEFISNISQNGILICDMANKNIKKVLAKIRRSDLKIIDYFKETENWQPKLSVIGRHNISNAKAVFALCKTLKIKRSVVTSALKEFLGVNRRLETKGNFGTKIIIDDYAHHPTEIEASLRAVKEAYQTNKITVVFQPHLFSRTKIFLKEFAKSLDLADKIIISDIYAAREKDSGKISSKDLVCVINNLNFKNKKRAKAEYGGSVQNIIKIFKNKNNLRGKKKEIIMTMGAGDIYKVSESFFG